MTKIYRVDAVGHSPWFFGNKIEAEAYLEKRNELGGGSPIRWQEFQMPNDPERLAWMFNARVLDGMYYAARIVGGRAEATGSPGIRCQPKYPVFSASRYDHVREDEPIGFATTKRGAKRVLNKYFDAADRMFTGIELDDKDNQIYGWWPVYS